MQTPLSNEQRRELISQIADLPTQVRAVVGDLTDEALTTASLAGEWTVAQNVHHLADSHMNSYIRIKLILTEEEPTLKPYNEQAWAKLADADCPTLEASLLILDGLHRRWAELFESLTEADWQRAGYHPEVGQMSLDDFLRAYVEHGRAHLDQIQRTLTSQY